MILILDWLGCVRGVVGVSLYCLYSASIVSLCFFTSKKGAVAIEAL